MKVKKINEFFANSDANGDQLMFAYGSLSNTKLRHLLLDEVSTAIPCKISKEFGYKRNRTGIIR